MVWIKFKVTTVAKCYTVDLVVVARFMAEAIR
jgi:hypothetical protein